MLLIMVINYATNITNYAINRKPSLSWGIYSTAACTKSASGGKITIFETIGYNMYFPLSESTYRVESL